MYYTVYTAPIGALYILEKDGAIIEVKFDDESFLVKEQRDRFKQEDTPVLKEAKNSWMNILRAIGKCSISRSSKQALRFKSKCGRHFLLFRMVNQKLC